MNESNPATNLDERSRWGRVKFGDGRMPALGVAAPIGIVLAVGVAALVMAVGQAGPRPIVGGLVVAALTLWPLVALVWALLVDRRSLLGATANAEQSIESTWYERAAAGAFTDTLLVAGLGTAAVALTGVEVTTVLVLSAVIVTLIATFGVRYLVQRRRG